MKVLLPDHPYLTRRELVSLSPFRLPAKAGRRDVPGLSYEQIRTLERHGLFDDFRLKRTPARGVWVLWKLRKRGDTRLYTLRDLAVVRLVAWMLRDGLTMQECARALRTDGAGRVTLSANTAEYLYYWRVGRDGGGCIVENGASVYALTAPNGREWRFPLAWLGMGGDWLPRIQKMRQRTQGDGAAVWRHRWMPAEELAELQARESAAGATVT